MIVSIYIRRNIIRIYIYNYKFLITRYEVSDRVIVHIMARNTIFGKTYTVVDKIIIDNGNYIYIYLNYAFYCLQYLLDCK